MIHPLLFAQRNARCKIHWTDATLLFLLPFYTYFLHSQKGTFGVREHVSVQLEDAIRRNGYCRNWNTCKQELFIFLELRTDPGNTGPCTTMLQRQVMDAGEGHSGGPQDLVTPPLAFYRICPLRSRPWYGLVLGWRPYMKSTIRDSSWWRNELSTRGQYTKQLSNSSLHCTMVLSLQPWCNVGDNEPGPQVTECVNARKDDKDQNITWAYKLVGRSRTQLEHLNLTDSRAAGIIHHFIPL